MEVAFQGGPGDLGEVTPDQAIAETAGLQLGGRPAGPVAIVRIGLGPAGGEGIEPVQVGQADAGFQLRVDRPGLGLVESPRLGRQTVEQGRDSGIGIAAGDDQQPHLEAPIAEVGVAHGLVAPEAIEPLDGLADDRGPQVADVHFLGHVGPAVVHQHAPDRLREADADAIILGQGVGPVRQRRVAHFQIDEARSRDLHRGDPGRPLQGFSHRGRDLPGVALRRLGRRQGAVALEVGQVRPVRRRHPAQPGWQPKGGEGGAHRFAQARTQVAHGWVGVACAVVVWPARGRKRLPSRLKAAICGVTSKPIRTSKLAPLTSLFFRGMTICLISWVS